MANLSLPPQLLKRLSKRKQILLPILFLALTLFVTVTLYREGRADMVEMARTGSFEAIENNGFFLPLLAFNISLICLIVVVYLILEIRTEYLQIRTEFDEESAHYVRRTADALRTPLTSLRWVTEMLLAGDLGKINIHQKEGVQKMNTAVERLIREVNELLKVAKLSGGLIRYKPAPANVMNVIQAAQQDMEPLLLARRQKLLIKGKMPAIFPLDALLIQHVLGIFIGNAIRQTPTGGEIILEAASHEKGLLLTISACGVDDCTLKDRQEISTIPGMFKTSEEVDRDEMSLSVSYEIIQAAKGKLWVENVDKKCVYSILLPTTVSPSLS